jgi:O-antigen ligase
MEGVPFVLTSTDPSGAMRLEAWGNTLRIFMDYPATGTGLGTFQWIYPSYQRMGEWMNWGHAHNDYIQLLSEAGSIGAILLVWAFAVYLRRFLNPALSRRKGEPRWTSVAVAAAVFAMLVHSIFDFNLQIPANAGLFAIILGVLAGAAHGRDPGEDGKGAV